jgi:hypothetical protein
MERQGVENFCLEKQWRRFQTGAGHGLQTRSTECFIFHQFRVMPRNMNDFFIPPTAEAVVDTM